MTTTLARVQHARDTAAHWTSTNTVLLAGEIGYETDTRKFKIGDGTATWAALPYQASGDPSGTGVFFPEDSGAAGNGTTDDTTAVQAAFTAAQNYTTSNPGRYGTVAFRSIYKISSTVTATAQIAVVGVATDGCGLLASGSGFTGTNVLSIAPASQAPAALDSFSITDSSATRTLLALSNVIRGQVTGLDLSGGQDQILFNNVNDSRVAGNVLRNGINAFAFRTATSSHVQFHNNRVRDATYVYFLASSGIVTSLTYTGDDIINGGSGANVTNNNGWLAAAQANTPKSGTTFHSGTSANSAVVFLEPNSGTKTHVRRGQFALEFLNNAFTTVIASLDNGGELVLNDALQIKPTVTPTAAASEVGSIRYVAGGAGVADTLQVCLKAAGGTYSWKTIAAG